MDVQNERMFELPKDSQILCVKMMPDGKIYLWALINTDETKTEMRRFILIGTGWTIRDKMDGLKYIGTIIDDYQASHNFIDNPPVLVWHIFEVIPSIKMPSFEEEK